MVRLADSSGRRAWPAQVDPRSRRLGGWADGYTADATYLDQVNVDHSPAWFSWVSVMNGQPPLDADRPLTWLDVGCGTGLAACSVAAGNPNVTVWGVDYNPAHVERARNLARAAGLGNCHFVEASFEQLAEDPTCGPAEVDVAVVNGVYSWISTANRDRIVTGIGRRLRPGGLVHLMYEVSPGWSSMPPLAEALRLAADADGRPGDIAFHDAAAQIVDLRANGARFFPIGSRESGQVDSWSTADRNYAAHEYLGQHFAPLTVDEVVESMAAQKCLLLGSIGPLDHHHYYSTPPEFEDVLQGATDPLARELVRDLIMQRPLRRDLFRRGLASSTGDEQRGWAASLRIRGTGRPFSSETLELPAMKVSLDPAFHVPLVEALTHTDLDVDTVLGIHPDWSFADATSALGLLLAAGYATPLVAGGPSPEAVTACRRLNEVLIVERGQGHAHPCLADPSNGAMYELDLVEVVALDGILTGAPIHVTDLADLVENAFVRQDRVVREDGELVRDGDKARTIIERRVTRLMDRLPALQRRGIT